MKVGIIGSGAMGSGIAHISGNAGFETYLFDNNVNSLENAEKRISESIKKLTLKGKITDFEAKAISDKITFLNDFGGLSDCDIVIEAVFEDIVIKRQVIRELEIIVNTDCIIASNTSSFSITSIAKECKNPERVIGIHFFNPPPLMPLVEIIPALQTDKNSLNKSINFAEKLKKTVVIAKDTPGFIVNRIARPFYGESFKIYEEGIADFTQIDFALKKLGNFKMGPFELSDFIGHDINYNVTESIWKAFYYEPRFKPTFCQKQLLDAGFLGKKSGRGFYNYQDLNNEVEINISDNLANEIFERVLAMLINEAAEAVYTNIASVNDIETAIIKGLNYPKGLLTWANEFGIEKTVKILDLLYEKYRESRYRCSVLLREMSKKNLKFEMNNK